MKDAAGRTVLVTGGARRLGRAIALDLAAAGWQVAVHYRGSLQEAEATAAECEGLATLVQQEPVTVKNRLQPVSLFEVKWN